MPKKICPGKGCNNLINMKENRCLSCEPIKKFEKAEHNRKYDKKVREPHLVNFYHSKAWKTVRQYVLVRDNNLCQECLKDKTITSAALVHHKIEIRDDFSKAHDPNNCVSVCKSCHNRISHQC